MRSDFKAIGIILIIQLSAIPHANGAIERDFSLTSNPTAHIVSMGFDAAGYSDWWDWGYHWPRHPYSAHEMLSGEWAAAVHYAGIASGDQAMWLTDQFSWPDWPTYTGFSQVSFNSWNSDDNPIDGLDTAQSVIQNSQVRITIDYEMVDLGVQGPYSPLSFGSLVGGDAFVYSERYVLLQTYTITNKTASSIQNLQFYQMLHGHPADEYNAVVFSVYDDTAHEDPLEDYVPWNDVHCEEGSMSAGNFKYDITQWNNPDDPDRHPWVSHRDWIGFSSTVPPDFFENGYYEGHDAGKPPWNPDRPGTHWKIEARTLLNDNPYSFGEAAGAMGWSLGTLAADDSVKLTLAIMFGAGPIQKTCQPFEPIAYWGLDEGSGAIAHDSIGDNDGTLFGDPEPEWVAGYHDGALEFGGTGYVALSDPVGALTGDSVTVSAWVKPGANMGTEEVYDIFSQTKRSTSYLFGYSLYLQTGDSSEGGCRPGFRLKYPGVHASSSDEIEKGEWAWVVGTNDGTTLKVYVNGVLKASADSTGRMGVYSDAYIGYAYAPGADPFIGVIDCVRVLACAWDGEEGCLPYCHQDYFDGLLLGRPDCWCTPYQCDGDADGETQGVAKYRVYTNDLDVLIANWQKKAGDPTLNPCADLDHKAQGLAK